jgi:heme/copper-type cytochrome/quinol oxidase subunit 1
MTTVDPHAVGAVADASDERAPSIVAVVGDWVTTADHKKIGRLFIGTSLLVLLSVTVVGALLGVERADTGSSLLDAGALPQLFAYVRVVLTFGVVVPLLLGIAVAVVPLQIGARALALPRAAMLGFFSWFVGAVLVIGTIASNGGPGGGDEQMVDLFLIGHVVLLLGLVLAIGTVVTTILTARAPGMNMRRVPMFAWSVLVGGVALLLVLPVLIGTLVLLAVDHRYARTAFGGNVGITEWAGFAFTQPVTFLYAVPAFGLLLETAATATRQRQPVRGIALIGVGLVGTAFLAGVSQVDAAIRADLADADAGAIARDVVRFGLLDLLPLLGAVIVLGLALLNFRTGARRVISPLVFSLFGVLMIVIGMVGGAVYHVGDAQLAGTVFEEAAWIYVGYGAVLAALGGIVYWSPKLSGRRIPEAKVLPLALLGVLATVLASFPYYIAGFADQPAGTAVFDIDGPQNLWSILVAVGHGLMFLTVLAVVGLVIRCSSKGEHAGDDPWDGQTLEWATSSPAPADNFTELHVVASPQPLLDLKPATTEGAA